MPGLVYAIGDLHGRLDLFAALIETIRRDAEAQSPYERPVVVLLGDLIDRGPDSAGCIERAIQLRDEGWCDLQALKGNHEEALMLFLGDPEIGRQWFQHGGGATLQSYGVDLTSTGLARGWTGVQASLLDILPASHRDFLSTLKLHYQQGDYVFVHAGVRPGRALEQQSEADLLWIREAFLDVEVALPSKVVVHGHTPTPGPELKRGRINVDTGAYASGVLTAVRLRGFERTILQAR
jgi:serine/threonine protein phosphatase 1